jgi:hypothetical protein
MGLTPVLIPKPFKKRLEKKEPRMQAAILATVQRLREDHRHNSLRTHRIQGQPGVYGASIDMGNRLTFCWDNETIVLLNHCNHDILSGRKS